MKIDKDALLKHRFWILVGLSVPFTAVAILLLVTSISSSIEAIRKTLKTDLDGVKNQKDVYNELQILEQKAAAGLLLKEENLAWEAAFKEQEKDFRWPRKMEATFQFADGMFANEVQILKLPADNGEWPENKSDLIHGTLKRISENDFAIDVRDPKTKQLSEVRFRVTPTLLTKKGAVSAKDGEDPNAADLGFNALQKHMGKLLAVGYQKARYFNDRLTSEEQLLFAKTYLSQIPPILRQVDPLRIETGEDGKPQVQGVVQLKSPGGWTFKVSDDRDYEEIPLDKRDSLIPPEGSKFLRFVSKDWNVVNDASDELWIAQEDLWIQNEIYRVIRAANDSISQFTEINKGTKPGETVKYQNPYFDISLGIKDGKTLEVEIKNRLDRRQKIDGMNLRIKFVNDPKAAPEIVAISGDLLESRGAPGGKDVFKKSLTLAAPKTGRKREHVFGLEQVLTWDVAAVKRIDHIAIGSSAADETSFSHRTLPLGLQQFVKVETKKAEGGDKGGGNMMEKMMGGPRGNAGFPMPGGGNVAAGIALANGLMPERYQEVTPQFRRVPVAIALIVDQNHVDRVQTAFNNSKLRILVTQVLLNHFTQSLKPQLPDEKVGEDAKPGAGVMPPPAFFGAMMGKMKGGFPPGGINPPGIGQAAPVASVDDLDANMELVIYGVVTLYERFPARAAVAAAPKAP